ncbi:MAG: formate dehydrogenase subunit delta [Alphaproteobacteria bacterium]|nr:formate dehydrogenase subunit delta [Alphaproteobacteria bacterium]
MQSEKLITMANQIAKFFAHQGGDVATAAVADHLAKFWDPRMRAQIIALVHDGQAAGLDPLAAAAVKSLKPA